MAIQPEHLRAREASSWARNVEFPTAGGESAGGLHRAALINPMDNIGENIKLLKMGEVPETAAINPRAEMPLEGSVAGSFQGTGCV